MFFGIPGMIGTYGGAWIAQYVSGILQLSVFAGVMLMAAFFMLKPPKLKPANLSSDEALQRSIAKIIIDGLLVGILTGFVGVGGGFLIVPALVLLGGLTMKQAVGTSLLIIAMKSYSGFYKYLEVLDQQSLHLDWHVIFSVSMIGIIGSFLGSYFGAKIAQDKLKKGFGYFLIVMGIWILYQNLPQLIG